GRQGALYRARELHLDGRALECRGGAAARRLRRRAPYVSDGYRALGGARAVTACHMFACLTKWTVGEAHPEPSLPGLRGAGWRQSRQPAPRNPKRQDCKDNTIKELCSMKRRIAVPLIVALLLSMTIFGIASAHAKLVSSDPAAGAKLTAAPAKVTLI